MSFEIPDPKAERLPDKSATELLEDEPQNVKQRDMYREMMIRESMAKRNAEFMKLVRHESR